jgi:hypothetical protein
MRKLLSEIATLYPGLSLLRRRARGAGVRLVPVISVGDLEAEGVAPADRLTRAPLQTGPATERYRVQEGDVLVTARGTLLKVALVGPESAGALASSNLIVVRAGPDVLPAVLLAFLRNPRTQGELLSGSRSSSGALALTANDLGGLLVPVPPLAEQRRVAELLEAVEANYRAGRRAAEVRRQVGYELANKLLLEGAEPGDSTCPG